MFKSHQHAARIQHIATIMSFCVGVISDQQLTECNQSKFYDCSFVMCVRLKTLHRTNIFCHFWFLVCDFHYTFIDSCGVFVHTVLLRRATNI